MALEDPNMMEALKATSSPVRDKSETLKSASPNIEEDETQLLRQVAFAYKIQDHAFRLTGCGTGDSLFLSVHTKEEPHCIHIPRQIPRQDLIKLLPDRWITNYEKIHEGRQPVQSTNIKIISKKDGTSEIRFDHSHLRDQPTPTIFPTQMMMLPQGDPTAGHDTDDPDCYCELCHPGAEARIIENFAADGKPIYYFRDPITGHCPWDEDCSCERWKEGDRYVGPLGEENGKFIFLVDYGPKTPKLAQTPSRIQNPFDQPALPPPAPQKLKPESFVQPCYKRIQKWVKKNPQPNPEPEPKPYPSPSILMFQPTSSSYDKYFPPLEEFTEKEFKHAPKIPTALLGGKTSAAESTLNWQTENAIAQNKVLSRIDSQVTHMGTRLTQVEIKVDSNTKIANELMVLFHKRLQQLEK
ncbi:hypothetical protein GQ457_04G023890 [Hibiscus cannabinus]